RVDVIGCRQLGGRACAVAGPDRLDVGIRGLDVGGLHNVVERRRHAFPFVAFVYISRSEHVNRRSPAEAGPPSSASFRTTGSGGRPSLRTSGTCRQPSPDPPGRHGSNRSHGSAQGQASEKAAAACLALAAGTLGVADSYLSGFLARHSTPE